MPYSPEQPQHRRPSRRRAARRRRTATLATRPNVTFGVRMRLHSLELAKRRRPAVRSRSSCRRTRAAARCARARSRARRARRWRCTPRASAALPNPPFAPAHVEQLSKHPPQLTLPGGHRRRRVAEARRRRGAARRGAARLAAAAAGRPEHAARPAGGGDIPSSCSALITAGDGTPLGTVHLVSPCSASTNRRRRRPRRRRRRRAARGARRRRRRVALRLALSVLSVRDLAIRSARTPTCTAASRTRRSAAPPVRARVARTAAPVSLGRHSRCR